MSIGEYASDFREFLAEDPIDRGTDLPLRDHDRAIAEDALLTVRVDIGRDARYGIWHHPSML